MKFCVLMGSPRTQGNTAALLAPFLEECAALGIVTENYSLYSRTVNPCLGCMTCQDCLDGPGCVQDDDFEELFQAVDSCDVMILATPIYSFFCTPPMKALLDRAIYAGVKNYGRERGPRRRGAKRGASGSPCVAPSD